MIRSRLVASALSILVLCCLCVPGRAADAPKKTGRVLMLSQSAGFKHGSVNRQGDKLSPAEQAVTELGVSSGVFRADCTQDAKSITKDQLDQYDIVFFYTTGNLPFEDSVRDYLLGDWIKQKGHGFIGTHSAADTFNEYQPYWEMLGGTFDGHPWGSGETVTITVDDPTHPASKPWGSEFQIKDEIYKFRHWQPEKVRVLASLNMDKTRIKNPYHVPVLWVKQYGDGRVMHMSLGHNEAVWANPTYRESLLGGINWMLGNEPGDATPNPAVSASEDAKAKAVVAAQEAAAKAAKEAAAQEAAKKAEAEKEAAAREAEAKNAATK